MHATACFRLALAIGLGLALTAPAVAQDDQKLFAGTWNVADMTFDGQTVPKDVTNKFAYTFADGKVTVRGRLAMQGDTFIPLAGADTYTVKLGTDGKLKTIDLVPENPKHPTVQGLYEIDGDTLKLCLNYAGKRPKEFASPENTGTALETCQREKK